MEPTQNVRYPDITVLVGSGRSGTTYLAVVLKQSLDMGFSAEPKFVASLHRRLPLFGDLSNPKNLRRLATVIHNGKLFRHLHGRVGVPSTVDELLERVQEPTYTGLLYATFGLIAEKRGHLRLAYKDPWDVQNIALISRLLPTARFIHILRDGRDVAASMLKFEWGATNLYAGCRYWARTTAIGRRDGALLGDRYLELRLEDLMADRQNLGRKLGAFVLHDENSPDAQKVADHLEQSGSSEAATRWPTQLSSEQVRICEAAAGQTLEECGYPLKFGGKATVSPVSAGGYLASDFALRVRNRLTRKPRVYPGEGEDRVAV